MSGDHGRKTDRKENRKTEDRLEMPFSEAQLDKNRAMYRKAQTPPQGSSISCYCVNTCVSKWVLHFNMRLGVGIT